MTNCCSIQSHELAEGFILTTPRTQEVDEERSSVGYVVPYALPLPRSQGGRSVDSTNPIAITRVKRIALCALVLLAFGNRFTLEVGGLTLRPEHLLGVAILATLGIGFRVPKLTCVRGWPFLVSWLVLALISSMLYAPSATSSLKTVGLYAGGIGTLAVVVYLARRHPHHALRVYLEVWFIAISVGIVGIIIDAAFGTTLFTDITRDVVTYRRIRGTFWEPNFYGISAMMLGVIYYDRWTSRGRQPSERLVALRTLVCAIAVVLSGTRSAQAGFALGVVSVTLFRPRSRTNYGRYTFAMVAAGLFLTLVMSGLVHTSYSDRVMQFLSNPENSSSYRGRMAMYKTAIGQMPGRLLLGHGSNTYKQYNPMRDSTGMLIADRPAEYIGSLPISIFYDTGIVGVLLIVTWLFMHHRAALIRGRIPTYSVYLWPFALSSLLMFFCFCFTDGTLLSFPWVHVAMTVVLYSGPSSAPVRGDADLQTALSPRSRHITSALRSAGAVRS